jgi:putative endonuclease
MNVQPKARAYLAVLLAVDTRNPTAPDSKTLLTIAETVLSPPRNRSDVGGYLVYILECSDGSLYTGTTNDLPRRLTEHGAGKGSRYTRSRLPVKLKFAEEAVDRRRALRREWQIKKMSRSQKLLLCSDSPLRVRLSSR